MAEAAERMGPSVLGGALTTVCAVVFLLFGDLKAFVKERITDGKPIDLDMFGAFVNNTAQIKRKA